MRTFLAVALAAAFLSPALAGPTYTDPEKTDADFPYMGEYSGTVGEGGDAVKVGVQVIGLGKGKFRAIGYQGGLPGDGWDQSNDKVSTDGELKDGQVVFAKDEGKGTLKDGKITLNIGGRDIGTLEKVNRKSTTLAAKPPQGAIVLFDGLDAAKASAEAFEGGQLTADKLLKQGCTSKQKFGSHKVHVEFRTPYQPEDNSQGRGNSGVYLQGRYEVQILDSFGLNGEQNECGGIYTVSKPKVNMCFPPLAWQTYDIDYTAAKYDGDKLVTNPRITVKHNGVLIHDNVELPGDRNTTSAPVPAGKEPGPLYLQDHGNPVAFRNVWVVETK